MVTVRLYHADDHSFVLDLAPRFMIGMPPWRDPQKWLAAIQGWISGDIDQHGQKTVVFIAEDEHGDRLGFAAVTQNTHWTGELQAYIGELATDQTTEGRGAGKALLQSCEQWARDQGYRIISLETGAANTHALGFYHHLGYQDEDVKLVKLLKE